MKLSLLPALLSLHKQTAAQLFTIMLSPSAPVARLVRSKRVNHHHNYLPSIKLEVVGFPLCAARILSARTPGGGRRNGEMVILDHTFGTQAQWEDMSVEDPSGLWESSGPR